MMKTQDENTFFKTDHHWNGLGAYYAYVTFCETKGIMPVSLNKDEEIKVEDFVGSYIPIIASESIKSFGYHKNICLKLSGGVTRMYMDESKNVTKLDPYSISKSFYGWRTILCPFHRRRQL